MPERLRVAIVGAGIGAAHAEGYAAHPELFELALICDADGARAAALAGRLPASRRRCKTRSASPGRARSRP